MSMSANGLSQARVLVVGAGIMGSGIAQVAAQAGQHVALFDTRPGAAEQAYARLGETFAMLERKGKLSAEQAKAALTRMAPVASLQNAADAGLVVEAIVENLDVKRAVLAELEAVMADDCVLATNTSSLSITALGRDMRRPERLVGMHFFNPVPLMKLVEVVSGLRTARPVADAVFALARRWGKTAVHARSTPGFIVNRIARPFYAETLALLQVQAAEPHVLDACLRGAGFRMGPCELMDLIGHDTNFAVTSAVYAANFQDKRFVPSLLQGELVDGGLLGRKAGRGFYDYTEGAEIPRVAEFAPGTPPAGTAQVCGSGPLADRLAAALKAHGSAPTRDATCDWTGLRIGNAQLRLTDGRRATALGGAVAVFDLPLSDAPGTALAWAPSARADAAWIDAAPQWLRALGFNPQRVADAPGLVVARTIAMLINEAADAVQQGVCTADDADAAMRLGVNYPAGPFTWLTGWSATNVARLLDNLDAAERGERYRVSPWLRERADLEAA